jgi:hypothetical protein
VTVSTEVRDLINKNDDALKKLVEQTNSIPNAKFKDKKISSHGTKAGNGEKVSENPDVG